MEAADDLDVAIVRYEAIAEEQSLQQIEVSRVDRTVAGRYEDCTAIGYSDAMRDSTAHVRAEHEFHGTIYATDDHALGYLLATEALKATGMAGGSSDGSQAWGGYRRR